MLEKELVPGECSWLTAKKPGSKSNTAALGNDSESLSALKSNMGDREIAFFKLTDYL